MIAEKVGREILESKLDPAAWAAALSESKGNREQALSLYARLRMRFLEQQHSNRVAKIDSLESRRLKQCLAGQKTPQRTARSVRDLLDDPHPRRHLNFLKPRLSPLWLTIFWIGTTGTTATLGHLLANFLRPEISNHLIQISACCGLLVVGGALILRQILPKPWILRGWNVSLVATCNLVCLSSLFLGTKIIKRTMAKDFTMPPAHHIRATPSPVAKPTPEPPRNPYLVSTGIVTGAPAAKN